MLSSNFHTSILAWHLKLWNNQISSSHAFSTNHVVNFHALYIIIIIIIIIIMWVSGLLKFLRIIILFLLSAAYEVIW